MPVPMRTAPGLPGTSPSGPSSGSPSSGPARGGFTLMELLVVLVIVATITVLTAVALARIRTANGGAVCAANLRQVAFSLRHYATDNANYLPTIEGGSIQWEDLLLRYVPRKTFRCPQDQELFPSLGSSYDWRDTGNPATTFAGRSVTALIRPDLVLAFESLPGWHKPKAMYAVFLDDSVLLMGQEACVGNLMQPVGP